MFFSPLCGTPPQLDGFAEEASGFFDVDE